MGFLEKVGKGLRDELGKVLRESSGPATTPKRKAARQETTPLAERGPDPGTLVSPEEIEAATGSAPVGEGDRRSGGMDTDIGFFRVCIWQLADGGQLIVNSTRIRGPEGEALLRSRWDDPSWQEGGEKPLAGVGELARTRVTKSPKGGTELHVDAKEGRYDASLVHTSPAGSRDVTPLVALMTTLLSRLAES